MKQGKEDGKNFAGLSFVEAGEGSWKIFWGAVEEGQGLWERLWEAGEQNGECSGQTSIFGTRMQPGRATQTSRSSNTSKQQNHPKAAFWVHDSTKKE